METTDWPVDGELPDWRHVTIVAAGCTKIQELRYSTSFAGTKIPEFEGVDVLYPGRKN
jgi:hypothetical protein